MGYTHYFKTKREFTNAEWKKIMEDVITILDFVRGDGVRISGIGGYNQETRGREVVNENEIFMNGVGDSAHETFVICKEYPRWDFCKTARKPYDLAVTAILAYLATEFPDAISVSSDGEPSDWVQGVAVAGMATLKDILVPDLSDSMQ